MAHSLSAKKRVKQNATRRAINRWRKTRFREAIKQFNETVLHGPIDQARQQFRDLQKTLDQVAAKGTIHKNTAARYKARLAARLNAKKTAQTTA